MPLRIETIGGLNTYIVDPASGGKPSCIVVLLHGYGADGRDLIDIGAGWAASLPDCVFVSPDAPALCEISPSGRQWFSLKDYNDAAMTIEIEQAWETLDRWLDAVLEEFRLNDKDMVLGGFSQGCMMSLYTAMRRKNPCAGIIGYSGRLLGGGMATHNAIPIHLIHGEADTVVPVSSWHDAKKALESHGYTVSGYTTPHLPHGIDMKGLQSGLDFIRSCLEK